MDSGAVRNQEPQPLSEVIRTGKCKNDPESARNTADMRRAQLMDRARAQAEAEAKAE